MLLLKYWRPSGRNILWVIPIMLSKGDDFFYAITVDTEDASYLIKVPVKIDTKANLNDDDPLEDINDEKESEDSYADSEPSTDSED